MIHKIYCNHVSLFMFDNIVSNSHTMKYIYIMKSAFRHLSKHENSVARSNARARC
jgi:hypothetical protein